MSNKTPKETLEEASKKFAENTRLKNPANIFFEGAKWQEEHINSLIEEKDKEIDKAHKHIRILLAFLDGQLDADREEHGENYAEATVSINAKEYLNNFINEYRKVQ